MSALGINLKYLAGDASSPLLNIFIMEQFISYAGEDTNALKGIEQCGLM